MYMWPVCAVVIILCLLLMPFPVLSFKRFRNAVIEITSMDAGVFEVKGRVLGVALDKFELVFQVREREGGGEREREMVIALLL